MIVNGLLITVIGMLIIFGFLIIVVAAMLGLNLAQKKFFPQTLTGQTDSKKSETVKVTVNDSPDSVVVAVAVASIKAHLAVNRG